MWQLSVVHLATKSITRIDFQFSSVKKVGINIDWSYHHSVRSWKTRWKSDFGEKSFETCQIFKINFLTRQILKQSFHNASDFGLKKRQRVRFWIKNFTTRQISKKNIYLKSMILLGIFFKKHVLRKNYFWKADFQKKRCTQIMTFWFNLPLKMRNFCVLRAILKSTILRKKISEKHNFECKVFSKKHNFEWKKFVKSIILK